MNRDQRDKLIAIARRGMQKRFDWRTAAIQYTEMYQDAINKRRGNLGGDNDRKRR